MQKTPSTITIDELLKITKAGDIGLTENPDGIGKIIKWVQELEGDEAIYTHALIFGQMTFYPTNPHNALIFEANGKIAMQPLSQYSNKNVCIIRHKQMTKRAYLKGVKEIHNNLGMRYPYYRLTLMCFDTIFNSLLRKIKIKPFCKLSKIIHFDRPVCSELAAQFLIKSGVKTYFTKGEIWTNINPDDIHDAALNNQNTYEIIFEGKLINGLCANTSNGKTARKFHLAL